VGADLGAQVEDDSGLHDDPVVGDDDHHVLRTEHQQPVGQPVAGVGRGPRAAADAGQVGRGVRRDPVQAGEAADHGLAGLVDQLDGVLERLRVDRTFGLLEPLDVVAQGRGEDSFGAVVERLEAVAEPVGGRQQGLQFAL